MDVLIASTAMNPGSWGEKPEMSRQFGSCDLHPMSRVLPNLSLRRAPQILSLHTEYIIQLSSFDGTLYPYLKGRCGHTDQ